MIGFWPYFLHAHRSEQASSAGTWQTTFFCWFFLSIFPNYSRYIFYNCLVNPQKKKTALRNILSLRARSLRGRRRPSSRRRARLLLELKRNGTQRREKGSADVGGPGRQHRRLVAELPSVVAVTERQRAELIIKLDATRGHHVIEIEPMFPRVGGDPLLPEHLRWRLRRRREAASHHREQIPVVVVHRESRGEGCDSSC